MIEGLFPRAVAGEHAAVADLNKVWGRKIAILGLRAPETAILRVIEETIPRPPNSVDKLERAINALLEDQQRSQAPKNGQVGPD